MRNSLCNIEQRASSAMASRSSVCIPGLITAVTFAVYIVGRILSEMKHVSPRPYLLTALLALFLGVSAFAPFVSAAEEQPQGARKIVSQIAPEYPELAKKMQIHGTVRLEALVAPNGKVKLTQVVGGSPVLVKAAVYAVEKWKWAPAPQETKEFIELTFHP
jgi:protein TonB